MNCTFFGHHDVSAEIKKILKTTISRLIEFEKIEGFYVGNNGRFDFYVQSVLRELKEEGADLRFYIVLSRVDEKTISENQKETVFPEELENAMPRFAISKRNEWLINNTSLVIAYVNHKFSNSIKWVEKARKKGIRIINLANENDICLK